MTSIEKARLRVLKGYETAAASQRQGFINARPLLREMIVILTQEISKDDTLHPEQAMHEIRALSQFGDFIATLEIPIATTPQTPARPSLSKPRE